MSCIKRGRKKTQQKPQLNRISNYFEPPKQTEANTIAKAILDELLSSVACDSETIVRPIIDDVLTCVERKVNKKHTGSRVGKKTFTDWKAKFPWLIVLDESESEPLRLTCSICQREREKLKLTSVWANEGSPNIQISSIARHNESIEHTNACKCEQDAAVCIDIQKGEQDSDTEDVTVKVYVSSEDTKLFRTVYFAAKSEIASETVNGLLALQALNGVDVKYKNLSWHSITSIQKSISSALTSDLVQEVKDSELFGIMLDESTDITVDKRLSICIRYVKAGEAVTKFLCNVPIEDGCSITIVNCVVAELEKQDLDLSKCTSLATDGAAAMMGRRAGAGVQFQSKYSPFCTQTHCVAHRLNLACTDSIKKHAYLQKFRDKFNSLYYFMSSSSLRTLALKKIQKLLEEPELSMKEPHSIRWLGLRNAVDAVFESYGAVLATLSKFAADKNPVAKGLYKYFQSYKVALVTGLMTDIHTELAILSCQFQRQNLMFSEIQPVLDGTLAKIDSMASEDGPALRTMKDNLLVDNGEATYKGEKMAYNRNMDAEFKTLRADYVKQIKSNIQKRFQKKDRDVFDDLSKVLEPITVNMVTTSESEDAVLHLGELYGSEKTVTIVEGDMIVGTEEHNTVIQPLLDKQKLQDEWPRLQGMIKGAYAKLDTQQLCKRLLLLHTDIMPNFCKLATIAVCMQLTSVECERSFSAQNRLKNKFRASLGSDSLGTLLTISMLGPAVETYDMAPAIKRWLRKKRRKGRLFTDYKPREPKIPKLC